jgi:hypothetical protein
MWYKLVGIGLTGIDLIEISLLWTDFEWIWLKLVGFGLTVMDFVEISCLCTEWN